MEEYFHSFKFSSLPCSLHDNSPILVKKIISLGKNPSIISKMSNIHYNAVEKNGYSVMYSNLWPFRIV